MKNFDRISNVLSSFGYGKLQLTMDELLARTGCRSLPDISLCLGWWQKDFFDGKAAVFLRSAPQLPSFFSPL